MKGAGIGLLLAGLLAVVLSIAIVVGVLYWAGQAVTERQQTDPMGDQLDILMLWFYGSALGLLPCVVGWGLFFIGGGLLAAGLVRSHKKT